MQAAPCSQAGASRPPPARVRNDDARTLTPDAVPPLQVVITFCFIGTIFVPLGAVCLEASSSVVEFTKRYDDVCLPNFGTGQPCTIEFDITEKMKEPVYIYYELHNFYQNHRRYVKSRSDMQLRGDSAASNAACDPKQYVTEVEGAPGYKAPVLPCGLIAWSYFNDTYDFQLNGQGLAVNEKGIAWKSDVNDKFGGMNSVNFNTEEFSQYRGGGTITGPLNEDEHFIVWMRTSALPTFRKLWGKIETDLEAGSVVSVDIDNRYNTYAFDGKKKVILSTASWLGGKNDFLGIAYLVVGCLCYAYGLVFLVLLCKFPRELGDVSLLSWNKHNSKEV